MKGRIDTRLQRVEERLFTRIDAEYDAKFTAYIQTLPDAELEEMIQFVDDDVERGTAYALKKHRPQSKAWWQWMQEARS